MVALSVAFYARLSVGSRQIVEIFNILNEFMGNIFGKVPAYTTRVRDKDCVKNRVKRAKIVRFTLC